MNGPTVPRRLFRLDWDVARLVVVFGSLVVFLLWGGIAWDLDKERARLLAAAESETANLARALEEHTLRTVLGLDQALLYLKAEYERDPARFDLGRSAAANLILRQVSVQVAVIDRTGWLRQSTVPGVAAMDLGDREHFKVHLGSDSGRLFISKPVLGRASGKWSIQLTRRLNDAQGQFGGVMVVSMDPGYFAEFYRSLSVGEGGGILLAGRDGVVRAASGFGDDALGRILPERHLVGLMTEAGPVSQRAVGPFDPQPRIVTFRAVPNLPLTVMVARSEQAVLAGYERARRTYALAGFGLSLVLMLAVVLLYQLVRRQQAIAVDLRAKREEVVASRERMKRYVADLERIAEVSAHDLQEPLRRVVAYAQLLARGGGGGHDEAREYLSHVIDGAQRMKALVHDLEAFVSVEHMPAAATLVPAKDALATVLERLHESLRDSKARVMVGPLPMVAVESRTLTEIFTQLIDNAVCFRAADRRPLIEIGGRVEGPMAVLTVRDNGIGIDPQQCGRIFELFHRLPGVHGKCGTGIGLALARRMVERLGGRIWVESVPGEGSLFSFSVPVALSGGQDGYSPPFDQESRKAA